MDAIILAENFSFIGARTLIIFSAVSALEDFLSKSPSLEFRQKALNFGKIHQNFLSRVFVLAGSSTHHQLVYTLGASSTRSS